MHRSRALRALAYRFAASRSTLYASAVVEPTHRSPTPGLILGLVITLAALVSYSAYITHQISGLRELQKNLVDRNRKDSIQLLRIQNDLNSLGLGMRDMLGSDSPYPITAWSNQFDRIRQDLADALKLEEKLSPEVRTADQRQFLSNMFSQFWEASDNTFDLSRQHDDTAAKDEIRSAMQPKQEVLSNAVARLLVANNESEEQAAAQVHEIYDRVQRQVYFFLTGTLAAILLTSIYVISSNRRLFAQLASLSRQRSDLAQQLITTQESTLRHISRELHDEFGQILTAVGAMLRRAGTHAPEGSSLRADLQEVLQTVQTTLESVRSLSQALHPVMLEEAGLESTLDWYIPTIERQSGIAISYEKAGVPFPVDGNAGVHVYRIAQEALNNVARHSGARTASVRLRFLPDALELEVEDHGAGIPERLNKRGIGLVAMRERSELMGGQLVFSKPPEGGTRVHLTVPREKAESHGKEDHSVAGG